MKIFNLRFVLLFILTPIFLLLCVLTIYKQFISEVISNGEQGNNNIINESNNKIANDPKYDSILTQIISVLAIKVGREADISSQEIETGNKNIKAVINISGEIISNYNKIISGLTDDDDDWKYNRAIYLDGKEWILDHNGNCAITKEDANYEQYDIINGRLCHIIQSHRRHEKCHYYLLSGCNCIIYIYFNKPSRTVIFMIQKDNILIFQKKYSYSYSDSGSVVINRRPPRLDLKCPE